ncbi:MAG TPA: hypothetical protein VM942_01155 [Acidimicrobiales bacterium]|nr:hypothetical protein [Acidimicrobiales bacterium]
MTAPGPSSRFGVGVVLAGLLLAGLAGCSSGPRRVTGGGAAADVPAADVPADDVVGRPWPARVTAAGPWSATMEGVGPRMTLNMAATIVGGLRGTTLGLGTRDEARPTLGPMLRLAGGERWYPDGEFRLEADGDVAVPAVADAASLDAEGARSVDAAGGSISARVVFADLLAGATGPVVARGSFFGDAGRAVAELVLPPGTTFSGPCHTLPAVTIEPTTPLPPGDCERQLPDGTPMVATVPARAGTTVRAAGPGEVAVAGKARATALDRSWEGLVVAVEGLSVEAGATYEGREWSVTGRVDDARQVWVDVWPVVDTILEARSFSTAPGTFDRNRLLRVEWVNVGFATAQILEAEGVGPGAPGIGFDLNKTLSHDAGIRLRRGDRVVGFDGGADVDSNLPPGGETDRELSYRAGQPATLVLRGNFPEVRIELAVPGT